MTFRELLENHKSYSKDRMKQRNFDSSETLVYVTPWNNHGYGELILRKKNSVIILIWLFSDIYLNSSDIAKWFHKFTLVSPVWLQLKKNSGSLAVTGTHDIDQGWMTDVRKTGAKIVPRIIFEIHQKILTSLLENEESIKVKLREMLKVFSISISRK